jgi:hypothetical protein
VKHELIPCVFVSSTSLEEGYVKKGNLSQTRELIVRTDKPQDRSETSLYNKQKVMLTEWDLWSVTCKHTIVVQSQAKHIVRGKVIGENLGN